MRAGDPRAYAVFYDRFKPILDAYAQRVNLPSDDWPVCVTEVLEDEALRLSRNETVPPVNLAAYLITAVRHRHWRLKRARSCRDKNYDAAADDRFGERVVSSLCSEDALRASRGPDGDARSESDALDRLARELRERLTVEEETLLVWAGAGVPHPQIAVWLGVSYDACTKRIWRLCRRLREETRALRAAYSPREQAEIDRFMRRAGSATSIGGTEPYGQRPDEVQRTVNVAG